MNDQNKTKRQLIEELGELRRRLAELEATQSGSAAGDGQSESNDRRWHSLVANTPVFILILDRDQRIRFANHTQAGAETSHILGKRLSDFCRPELQASVRECVERVIQTGKPDVCEGPAVCVDEQEYWYATHFGPILEGGEVVAVSAISINTTERTAELTEANARLQAEVEQRRQAEADLAIYRRFVEASTQGFGMADVEGRIIYVNPFLARLFGAQSPADVIGTRVGSYYPADYADRRKREIIPALRRGEPWRGEQMMVFPDGEMHPTIHTVFPVPDENGELFCTAAIITDITDLKQADEKLKAEQQALRRMLMAGDHERHLITYELHDGVAQKLMGALIHFQAHARAEGRMPAETESLAYGRGLDALRQASLELRRVMNGLRTPVLDRFGLAEAIEDVVSQLRLTPDAPKIEYRHAVQFQRLEPTLENALFRIAQEALTNACRHSRSEKVCVALTQKGHDVTLEVRDWGIGFDPAAVDEKSFGLDGIRERSRLLGGRLSISSTPNQGTVIQVTFPVMEAPDRAR